MQVLNQDETPLLYSLVFGEGVVNDATSVVLFNAIQSFDLNRLNPSIALHFLGNFLYLFVASTLLGVLVNVFLCLALMHALHRQDIYINSEWAHTYTLIWLVFWSNLFLSSCRQVCLVLMLLRSCILAGIFWTSCHSHWIFISNLIWRYSTALYCIYAVYS